MNNKFKKGIFTGSLLIGLLISLYFNFRYHNELDNLKVQHFNDGILIETNKIKLDSLKTKYNNSVLQLNVVLKQLKDKNKEQQILIKYEKIYETINSANDTLQYNILQDLLTKHSKQPIKDY